MFKSIYIHWAYILKNLYRGILWLLSLAQLILFVVQVIRIIYWWTLMLRHLPEGENYFGSQVTVLELVMWVNFIIWVTVSNIRVVKK